MGASTTSRGPEKVLRVTNGRRIRKRSVSGDGTLEGKCTLVKIIPESTREGSLGWEQRRR